MQIQTSITTYMSPWLKLKIVTMPSAGKDADTDRSDIAGGNGKQYS